MKMAESFPNGWKTLWEKEKLLVTNNFSFSHSVFKRLIPQTHKNQGWFGKGLKAIFEGNFISHVFILIFIYMLTIYHSISGLTTLIKEPFENIVGKGENAGNPCLQFHRN